MLGKSERNALSKALALNGAALVRRLEHGIYEVPYSTEDGATYIVCGVAMDASDHTCTCTAGQNGRQCWHVQAVRLRRVQEEAKKQARKLAERQRPAPATTATFRFNGVEYTGEGRNVLDALGNAAAA